MQTTRQADAIDPRLVFRAYAIAAGVAGLVMLALADTAYTRIAAAFVIAVACFAEALTPVADRLIGRRALAWFAGGHWAVGNLLMWQGDAIWGRGNWAIALVNVSFLVLFYFYWTSEGERITPPPPVMSLFNRSATTQTERLRSTYEEQIRQAAGQEERNRLARELHDSVKQQVFAIQTSAATAEVRFAGDPEGARKAIAEIRAAARDAMTEMEVMLDQLQAAPLENAGLIEALKKQCEATGLRTGARVVFLFDDLPPSEDLAPGVHQAIFRVAQEALANVAKHARAANVKVFLSTSLGWVRLLVEDDGAGFQSGETRRGRGIANMRARAEESGGFLDLETQPGGGTTVRLSVPYTSASASDHRKRTLGYGAFFGAAAAFAIWKSSPLQGAVALVTGIAACRQGLAWYRVNKRRRRADHRAG